MKSLNFGGQQNYNDLVHVSDEPVKGRISESSVAVTGQHAMMLNATLVWQHTWPWSFKDGPIASTTSELHWNLLFFGLTFGGLCCYDLFFNMQNLKSFNIASQLLLRHFLKGIFFSPVVPWVCHRQSVGYHSNVSRIQVLTVEYNILSTHYQICNWWGFFHLYHMEMLLPTRLYLIFCRILCRFIEVFTFTNFNYLFFI